MRLKQFEEYIDPLMTSKEYFYVEATALQNKKNKVRQPAKRWNEEKINRAVDKMWAELLKNVYEKLQWQVKGSDQEAWIERIQRDGFLEELNDSILEIEFE